MKIIPTLLTTNVQEFVAQMDLFQQHFDRIQLDIADGKLVPNKTTTIEEMITCVRNANVKINKNVYFDFHLMVQDYQKELHLIHELKSMGMNVNLALINAKHTFDFPELSAQNDFAIGLDIFPESTIEVIAQQYSLLSIKHIQIMTVQPGFQGSPFLPEMLMKIQQLRDHDYRHETLIDGGVNENSIPVITHVQFPPDCLCIGSYLTKAGDDLSRRIQSLPDA